MMLRNLFVFPVAAKDDSMCVCINLDIDLIVMQRKEVMLVLSHIYTYCYPAWL